MRTFRDERGRLLLDRPDAPLPDPDIPAPPRFLPAFDNAVLGYDDRSRIIDAADRGLSVAGARFLLLDGRVAATWTVDIGPELAVLRISPLAAARPVAARAKVDRDGVEHERGPAAGVPGTTRHPSADRVGRGLNRDRSAGSGGSRRCLIVIFRDRLGGTGPRRGCGNFAGTGPPSSPWSAK